MTLSDHLRAAAESARQVILALPENAPDQPAALRHVELVESALAQAEGATGQAPERLRSSLAFGLRQARFWLDQTRQEVEAFGGWPGVVASHATELRRQLCDDLTLLELGSALAAERAHGHYYPADAVSE
jgi:hypothetical protein